MNYKILEKCFKNATRNTYLIFLIIGIEYINIFMEVISITSRLLNKTQDEGIIKQLNDINPYYLIQKILSCKRVGDYDLCTFSNSVKIFLIVFIILFFFLYLLNAKYDEEQKVTLASDKEKKKFWAIFFSRTGTFFANLIFLIFHLLGMFLLFAFTNFLMHFVYSVSLSSLDQIGFDVVIFLFSSGFYFVFISFYVSYAKSLNVIVQFHEQLNFHSDNLFSRTYDFFLIYIKIIIPITNNLIIFEWENSFLKKETNYKILVCSAIVIFSIFLFTMSISYNILRKKILFIINARFNLFRIFLLKFTLIFLIFLISFHSQMNETILFIITVLTTFTLAVFVTYLISEKNTKNILISDNLIYQIAYVISKKQIQKIEELKDSIYHMFMMHKLRCDKNANYLFNYDNMTAINDNICPICEETEFTFESFLKSFYYQTKFLIKNKIEIYSLEEMELFTMIELLYISILQKHKIVKLYFKIVEILNHPIYKNKSVALCLNINRLKTFINNDNIEDIRIFRILKTYEDTSNLLKRIIDISDEIYTCYEFEKDIYKRAEQINIARDEILMKIVNLLKFSVGNKDSEDLYSLLIFKKIYEEIFNTNIDNLYYNFNQIEMETKISEKFRTDKMLTIKYDVSRDNFLITKASNELKVFYKKKLEDMFPEDFKIYARETFLKLIKENEVDNFQFQFFIKDPEDEIFIKNVFLKGRVCPSINFDELIINTTYEMSKMDIILFEENFLTNNKKILKSFSQNVGNMLCMTGTMLKNQNSYKFSFDDIFVHKVVDGTCVYSSDVFKQNFEKFKTNFKNDKMEYDLNLYHYLNLCLKINNIHLSNEGEPIINVNDLQKLKYNARNTKFLLEKLQEIKKEYSLFTIYTITSFNKIRTKNLEDSENVCSEEELPTEKNITISTPSTLSYISNAERELAYFQNTKQAQKSKKSTVNLNRLTTIASLFILFLISYSFVFMIIGIIDNQKIKESYSILMNYSKLKKTLYHTYTSLFNKFLLADYEGKYIESYNNYYNDLDKNSDIDMRFDKIAMIELRSKIDLIQQRMLEFQTVYLNSHYKDQVNKIMAAEIQYKVISVINGEYSFIVRNNNIFENLKTFMNLAQIIFEIEDIVRIDFIDYKDGNVNFTNIQNRKYDTRQIFGLEVIINYVNIFKQTESISNQLQIIQNEKLQSIYILTLVFFITFIIFHLSLIVICFYIIRSLRGLIANYLKLIDDLFSYKNVIYMKKKLSILKTLNELYIEDPSKLLKNLKNNKKSFNEKNRKERKEKEKKGNFRSEEDFENSKIYFDWENSKKYASSRNELIMPIIRMIAFIFLLFYIYSFIFYFLIRNAHEKFAQTSLIYLLNSSNENELFSNYNLLQFMFFTNSSDEGLYKELSNKVEGEEKFYIKNKIQQVGDRTVEILNIINENKEFNVIFENQKQLMECTYLYTNLNDDVLTLLYEKNENKDLLKTYFIEICKNLTFMKNGEVNMITQEVDYNMQQTLFKYQSNINDRIKILGVYYQKTLLDLYYILVYIFRPVQNYINYSLIYDLVETQENFYLLILLLFLSLNILVDFIILIFIKYKMIKKVLYISTYIENFIDAIKIV